MLKLHLLIVGLLSVFILLAAPVKRTYPVQILLIDQDNKAIPFIQVEVRAGLFLRSSSSDLNGYLKLNLPKGRYLLHICASDLNEELNWVINSPQTIPEVFRLKRRS